jgi:1-pyrroline-5-carboxylate dehydrogenase
MDGVTVVPPPRNEPPFSYAPGSAERSALLAELDRQSGEKVEFCCTIGGAARPARGERRPVAMPHDHAHVLGEYGEATEQDAADAITAALAAAPDWRALAYAERAAIFLRAADLLAGPWRARLNAATMLGQSKTAVQAEVDAACELIDFWRYNVLFGQQLLGEQPVSGPGVWNRLDHRPLEGFVYAVTPFNFTAIAGNLPTAPALMGNVVIWKPSERQLPAAQLTMRLLESAGLPPGVINLLTGDGRAVSNVALTSEHLAGLHFTGSTGTFQHLWQRVGENLARYRTYPRLVGETGGKDFVLAHPSAEPDVLLSALVRGAFEYQGQKCSAASRAYLPASLWRRFREQLVGQTEQLTMGDVRDLSHFMGAVIDRRAFDRLDGVLAQVRRDPGIKVLTGGNADDKTGFFVAPTVLTSTDPGHFVFRDEFFGPILSVYVYDDSAPNAWAEVLELVDSTAAYGLTGSVIATDRAAIDQAADRLRFTAGNFYVNDKPTGAVVGQQPFGGSRASGTNDKAGSILNLQRWVSPRVIKESLVGPTAITHPHQLPERG